MKQDQKRNGSFHFFLPVLEGNKSLSYYSALREAVNALDPAKNINKSRDNDFWQEMLDQSSNIKKKIPASEANNCNFYKT